MVSWNGIDIAARQAGHNNKTLDHQDQYYDIITDLIVCAPPIHVQRHRFLCLY